LRFLRKAIGPSWRSQEITIDKSGANTAAIESYNAEHGRTSNPSDQILTDVFDKTLFETAMAR